MSFVNIFSHSVKLPFSFVDCFLHCAEAFCFDEVPVIHFCFCFSCSGDLLSKKLLWLRSERFLPAFSLRILMASCLTFRSFIHFEFLFVSGIRKWSKFIFLHVAVQFFQHHLLKKLSLSHWVFFPACQRLVGHMFVGPFLGSLFCSIDLSVCSCASSILS